MPKIYLDPSVEETNEYVGGGNEEYYMNQIADAMIPYLRIAGIDYTRNNPNEDLINIIDQSNAGDYDLHLSLRSTPSDQVLQGPNIYYNVTNPSGQRAAYFFARNLWRAYPNPDLVEMAPNETLAQLTLTKAPSVLIDLVNPQNYVDTEWLRDNIYNVAQTLVASLTQYFGLPFSVKRPPLPYIPPERPPSSTPPEGLTPTPTPAPTPALCFGRL